MDQFQSALEAVLENLEQIRDGGGRWPRASRETLALLHELPISVGLSKTDQLAEVRSRVMNCDLCPHLAKSKTQTVFGVGNPDADLMFIGEAPGADEDRQGEPFVGRAGQLLTKIIETMGFRRDDVYIANILKSRPDMPPGEPGNRPPTAEEMKNCLPFLIEQIKIVQPKVMVALGATAVEGLLGFRGTMSKLRGNWHS